ncbi:MAG TPA: translation elongation factor 4 [Candidatus Paceibacterota bacterium]|nr:translation elongation factor 4 [Candidatus Paceibacterota bacterium]
MENIRNFCIIAHIDHGKSTLADRFLEITGTVPKREMKAQYLDQLELERERGITIKMAPVRMLWHPQSRVSNLEIKNSNSEYILNLIDTPGHSDFAYEVSRALHAVEGAILLVDATQGIQAQTLANLRSARNAGLVIIGAINKIDLFKDRQSDLETLRKSLSALINVPSEEIYYVSGKTGQGAEDLLKAVIMKIPPPKGEAAARIGRALIFDSFYDDHKGVVASIRVFDGAVKKENLIHLIATGTEAKLKEIGYFMPRFLPAEAIGTGEIGYIATGIKDPARIKIGDTVVSTNSQISSAELGSLALVGYKEPRPVVFVSFYPENPDDYELLTKSLEKLRLNDSALVIEPDQNAVLGRGFKVGFLGRLHFEITAERLKREFNVATTNTFPSVLYRVKTRKGFVEIVKPEEMPAEFEEIWEPMVNVEIIIPPRFLNDFYPLQQMFRMSDVKTSLLEDKIEITARMPLADLVSDFDDKLKSLTEGYASFSYEPSDYVKSDVVRVDVLLAGEMVPGLSRFYPRATHEREARLMVERLKKLLPRRQFAQSVQAASGTRIIAREDIPALKKDVTGYLYGGDRTRKMKLWQKQKRGKKLLKERAEVRVSPEVFRELLKK